MRTESRRDEREGRGDTKQMWAFGPSRNRTLADSVAPDCKHRLWWSQAWVSVPASALTNAVAMGEPSALSGFRVPAHRDVEGFGDRGWEAHSMCLAWGDHSGR